MVATDSKPPTMVNYLIQFQFVLVGFGAPVGSALICSKKIMKKHLESEKF